MVRPLRLSHPNDAAHAALALELPELALAAMPLRQHLVGHIPLRDYQQDIFARVAAAMRAGYRRILVVLPCGGGKTVLAAALLASTSALAFPAQFIVHRKELITQTGKSFGAFGIDHGFVATGHPMDLERDVLIAGVQTLANRLDQVLPPNTVIIDEAHHATASTWSRVMSAYAGSYIVGLTATPERLDGTGLQDHFDILIEGPSVADLIDDGWLSPFDYYAPTTPDLTGFSARAGDYVREQLNELMDRPALTGNTVEHYLRLAKGEQGIVFAVSREHSRHLADAFRAEGVRAEHIDGAMSDKERERIDEAFRAGDLDIMTNVDLFGEGYDVPNMVYCGLGRPTKSKALHIQQSMRPLRIAPGKRPAIICDHAGNAVQQGLGMPDTPRTWSLTGRSRSEKGNANDDASPVRQCLNCYRVSPSTVRTCPGCATEFPIQQRKIEQRCGELEKLAAAAERAEVAKRRKAEERACENRAELIELARSRGYSNPEGWARMKMSFRNSYGGHAA